MTDEFPHFAECPAGNEHAPGDCICRDIAEDIQADIEHDRRKEEGW